MITCLLAFLAGLAFGAIFSLLRLPIPAPTHIAGVLGIFGVFAGFFLIDKVKGLF